MQPTEQLDKYTVLKSLILIALLGFLVYSNSLRGSFIWDDAGLVRDNIFIRNFSNIAKIFTEPLGGSTLKNYTFYRPLQILTYMADYSFWKLDVLGYHLTNIFLHILVALCVYWFLLLLFDDWLLSLFAAILFIVHPVHTEAISYISGRADPLYSLFVLVAFIYYIKYLDRKKLTFYILTLLSFLFALLSKENALILPLLLCVYHYTFKKRINKKIFIPIVFMSLVYVGLRWSLLNFNIPHRLKDTTLIQRLPGLFAAITSYIGLMFLPFNLHMEYGIRIIPFSMPPVIFGIIITLFLLIYAFKVRNRDGLISFSIFFFFIALLPVSNIYPVNASMAEHWLYLPSIGFFIIIGWVLSSLYRIRSVRIIAVFILIGLISFYSYLTIKQNKYWREPISFYKRTLEYAPFSSRVYTNLADAYYRTGQYGKAIIYSKRGINIDPNNAVAYNNLGNAYLHTKEFGKAVASFKKAIEIDSNYSYAYNSLGATYIVLGEYNKAIALCKKSIELTPAYAKAYYNLALIYYSQGNFELAIKYCDKAIKLGYKAKPDFLELLKPYRD